MATQIRLEGGKILSFGSKSAREEAKIFDDGNKIQRAFSEVTVIVVHFNFCVSMQTNPLPFGLQLGYVITRAAKF